MSPRVRVLLLEDDPIFAKLLQVQLRTLADPACEVTREATLADALARIAKQPFDLILSDMGLPDSNGPATIDKLEAAARGIPIIVLSGSDEAPPGRAFLRKGGIGPEELARAIQGAVR